MEIPDPRSVLLGIISIIVVLYYTKAILLKVALEEQRKRRLARRRHIKRSCWSRKWLTRRFLFGQYDNLLNELHKEDLQGYKNYLRITPELFQEMVTKLTPYLKKKKTKLREPLQVGLKLAVTLRYLATGNSYASLQYSFRVQKSTICRFIPQVCLAIYKVYKKDVLKCPTTPEEWKQVAQRFSSKWNYHNCCGALDGKHVAMRKPANCGSYYYNYKGFHSVVLLALVDANYKFLYADVGAEGSASDGGIWNCSSLLRALEDSNRARLPDPEPLPHDDLPVPYHFVGDDAFALRSFLMKPYPHRSQSRRERTYSYRVSRARRVVENAFGILSHRFRCFLTTMQQHPKVIKTIILAGCSMHNLLITRNPNSILGEVDSEDPVTHDVVPGEWRTNQRHHLVGLLRQSGNTAWADAKRQRDYLSHYYTSPVGAVPWQDRMVHL